MHLPAGRIGGSTEADMETLWLDLKHSLCSLMRTPGFTLVALLTLALGIGANTAIFSMVHAVLLRPLPFAEPDRLMMLWERRPSTSRDADLPVSGHEFAAWKEQGQSFAGITIYVTDGFNVTGQGEPEAITALAVSADFFPVLGVRPALGRVFVTGEDQGGQNRVAILSNGYWRRRFAAHRDVVGQQLILDDQAHTIVGVLPELPDSLIPDAVVPLDVPREVRAVGKHNHWVLARLKPGVTPAQAQSELDGIAKRLELQMPRANTNHQVRMVPFREALVGNVRPALSLLFGAVGFVLLIACANVANLLLTRAAGRQKEIALRAALGASGGRLVRQILAESVLLSCAGGATGLLVAAWVVDALPGLLSGSDPFALPLLETVRVDGPVFAVALVLSLLAGVVTGLAPVLRSTRPNLTQCLGEGSRVSEDRGRRQLRAALVAGEVALSLVLLMGAGLMINSLMRLVNVNPGFATNNVWVAPVTLSGAKYAQAEARREFHDQLLTRLRALPGVESAGATSNLPLGGSDNWMPLAIIGRPDPPPGQQLHAPFRVVTPDYFRALRIPLRSGRFFADADKRLSVPLIRWFPQQAPPPNSDPPQPAPVAIISEAAARQYWPGEDPLGQRIRVLFSPELTIVGVVGDIKHNALDAPVYPHFYLLHSQEPWNSLSFVVRTSVLPVQLARAVREEVRALDSGLPVTVKRMDDVFSDSTGQRRFHAVLVGAFAAMALGLAVVGILGVVSYSVAQRTGEIGVRVALGAQPRDILQLIVGQGMRPVLIGVVAGAAGALALARFIEKLLFEVTPADPATFALVVLLLTGVALLACWIPARRAIRTDPMVALRHQ
jgi:putative ABC transport system permease protein